MSLIVYLAVPYSDPSPDVRAARAAAADMALAHISRTGQLVYSPISHSHNAAEKHGLPTEYEYWAKHCEAFVTICSSMIVLAIEGHDRSIGVAAEVALARRQGKWVEWMTMADLGLEEAEQWRR